MSDKTQQKVNENMANPDLKIDLPTYAVKHIESIRVLFAVNVETEKVESFVPMSMFLDLLAKIETLKSEQPQN